MAGHRMNETIERLLTGVAAISDPARAVLVDLVHQLQEQSTEERISALSEAQGLRRRLLLAQSSHSTSSSSSSSSSIPLPIMPEPRAHFSQGRLNPSPPHVAFNPLSLRGKVAHYRCELN
jgi:hypothetical protein